MSMSSLGTLITTSIRMQTIRRDPVIPEAAKQKMLADLQKKNNGIVETNEQSDVAAKKVTALGSAAVPLSPSASDDPAANNGGSLTNSPAAASDGPRKHSVQTTGTIIDKLA